MVFIGRFLEFLLHNKPDSCRESEKERERDAIGGLFTAKMKEMVEIRVREWERTSDIAVMIHCN